MRRERVLKTTTLSFQNGWGEPPAEAGGSLSLALPATAVAGLAE